MSDEVWAIFVSCFIFFLMYALYTMEANTWWQIAAKLFIFIGLVVNWLIAIKS